MFAFFLFFFGVKFTDQPIDMCNTVMMAPARPPTRPKRTLNERIRYRNSIILGFYSNLSDRIELSAIRIKNLFAYLAAHK
jgi:hypothetical protein